MILFCREILKKSRSQQDKLHPSAVKPPPEIVITEESRFVRVEVDKMQNERLILEDDQSNVIGSASIDNFSGLSGDLRNRMITNRRLELESLPEWVRTRLLETVGIGGGEGTTPQLEAGEVPAFVRRAPENSSGKRKRPESFFDDQDEKKKKEISPVKRKVAQFEMSQGRTSQKYEQ
jgi:hypothetical protein